VDRPTNDTCISYDRSIFCETPWYVYKKSTQNLSRARMSEHILPENGQQYVWGGEKFTDERIQFVLNSYHKTALVYSETKIKEFIIRARYAKDSIK